MSPWWGCSPALHKAGFLSFTSPAAPPASPAPSEWGRGGGTRGYGTAGGAGQGGEQSLGSPREHSRVPSGIQCTHLCREFTGLMLRSRRFPALLCTRTHALLRISYARTHTRASHFWLHFTCASQPCPPCHIGPPRPTSRAGPTKRPPGQPGPVLTSPASYSYPEVGGPGGGGRRYPVRG